MIKNLQYLIEEITKYGLEQNFIGNKYLFKLEKTLLKLLSFHIENEFLGDDAEYRDFDRDEFFYIKDNLKINFKSLQNYKYFDDITNLNDVQDIKIGNVIDDLNNVILDLLEVKYRIDHNGEIAGLSTFDHLFILNMKEKILSTLIYLNRIKNN